LVALVFRFPVPFAGYQSGLEAMLPAMVGAALYGLVGGIVVQAILGAVSGMIVYIYAPDDPTRANLFSLACGLLSALPGLLLLSILDWIIGPW
jgi:hypothetical protein